MTPEIVQITDYNAIAVSQLLSQYKRALRILGLIEAASAQADSVERMLWEIRTGFWLPNATGVQLDALGRVYGLARNGQDDATYRPLLQAQAASLVNGNPEEIMTFLAFVLDDPGIEYRPEYPAGFVLYTTNNTMSSETMRKLVPSGVAASFAAASPILDAVDDPLEDALGNQIFGVRR